MMEKKSQEHIEFVISFLLFVGFLVVLLLFIRPFSDVQISPPLLPDVEQVLIENITLEVDVVSVILSESGTCYNVPGGGYTEVQDSLVSRQYRLYYSESLQESSSLHDPSCNSSNFEISSQKKEKYVFRDLLVLLKQRYEEYSKLKESLEITSDFSYQVRNETGIIDSLSVSREVPAGIDVEAKNFPINIIDTQGIIIEGDLHIEVWE